MPKKQDNIELTILNKVLISLRKIKESIQDNGAPQKLDHELLVEITAKYALDNYKNNPTLFNAYPEEDYYPNDAKILLEYFCLCVEKKKSMPPELLDYFKDCFKKILKGGQTFERCLNIVGRKQKNPYLPPDYLEDITSDILDKGYTLIKACKEAHSRGVSKDNKTIMQNFNKFRQPLLSDWMVGKEINLKRKISTTDLTYQQIQAIKKYFKITFPTK